MKTLEQLKAEHEAALATLAREHEIAAAMPAVPDYVNHKGAYCPHVVYRGRKTLREAVALMRLFTLVPFSRCKDSCLSLRPESLVKPAERERMTISGVYACAIDVHQGEKISPSAKLEFFAQTAVGIIDVSINFGPDYIGAYNALGAGFDVIRSGSTSRSRIIEVRKYANTHANAFTDERVSWAGGERNERAAHFAYLLCADHDQTRPAIENTHALGQLASLSDALKEADDNVQA